MISIIICSVNKELLATLEKNINDTIGVPYEIIATDNSINHHGICKVYNEGGSKAKYPILCFMHEDILHETNNWGYIICRHLADSRAGLLGIAGGDAKSLVPSSWSIPIVSNEINLIQHFKTGKLPARRIRETKDPVIQNRQKVVALDGVLLFTKKEVFDTFKFDEKNFTGFHGYDIDYSLQVSTKYDVYVAFDILVHHFSEGNPDKSWVQSAIALSGKWKQQLPISVYTKPKADYNLHHWHSLRIFLQHLFRLNFSRFTILRFYLKYSFTRFFSLRRFLSVGKYVFTHHRSERF